MWFVGGGGGGVGGHCRSRGCHMTRESLHPVETLGITVVVIVVVVVVNWRGMVVLYREVGMRIVSEVCCVGVAELDAQGLAEESFVF